MATKASQIDFLLSGLVDSSGNRLANGTINTYEVGTTTNKATWKDRDKAVTAPNPLVLDSNGALLGTNGPIYADGVYDLVIKDSVGNTIDTATLSFGSVNPLISLNGPVYDADDFASFTTAVSTLGATEAVLLVKSPQTLDAGNVTVPDNIHLVFIRPGVITLGTNTLALQCSVTASHYKIFNYDSTGVVNFSAGETSEIYPQWWGAETFGSGDDAAAIQAAFNSQLQSGNNRGTVVFPPGSYTANSKLMIGSETSTNLGVNVRMDSGARINSTVNNDYAIEIVNCLESDISLRIACLGTQQSGVNLRGGSTDGNMYSNKYRFWLQGPGIAPYKPHINDIVGVNTVSVGVNYNSHTYGYSHYFNKLTDSVIREFDVCILLESPIGGKTGANGNFFEDFLLEDYWYGIIDAAGDGAFRGGFQNHASAPAATTQIITSTSGVAPSPLVFNKVAHGYSTDDQIAFRISAGGTFPGQKIIQKYDYYVKKLTDDTFEVARTPGGTSIDSNGTFTGTLTAYQYTEVLRGGLDDGQNSGGGLYILTGEPGDDTAAYFHLGTKHNNNILIVRDDAGSGLNQNYGTGNTIIQFAEMYAEQITAKNGLLCWGTSSIGNDTEGGTCRINRTSIEAVINSWAGDVTTTALPTPIPTGARVLGGGLVVNTALDTSVGVGVVQSAPQTFTNSEFDFVNDTFAISAHGLVEGDSVMFSSTATLCTGLAPGTRYYVRMNQFVENPINNFGVSATRGGPLVNLTTGSESGTHSVHPVFYIGDVAQSPGEKDSALIDNSGLCYSASEIVVITKSATPITTGEIQVVVFYETITSPANADFIGNDDW